LSPEASIDNPVRVLVVDDHPIWRQGVARDLAECGFEVAGTAGDGAQTLRVAAAVRPDVVLLDLNLPDMSGAQVTEQLLAAQPGVKVLILSASDARQDVLDAVTAGATGYVLKSADLAELAAALRATAGGHPVFTPGLAALVLGEYNRLSGAGVAAAIRQAARDDPAREPAKAASAMSGEAQAGRIEGPPPPSLTDRETEVLRLVAKGLTYPQIADRLTLSPRTVQNHVQNTLTKLQLHNKAQLVRYALEEGVN
jgi:DNA-binding NarL/FixJ family response regulator